MFISWSGERSRQIGLALADWLPNVFQGLPVWISDRDIQAGTVWGTELDDVLATCRVGIICLTPDNLDSHWLTFEAGALSKAIEHSRVIPFRFALDANDVGPPLSQFQGVSADRDGTERLVRSVHDAIGASIGPDRLSDTFQLWWPRLEGALGSISAEKPDEVRSDRDVLEEILEHVRQTGIRDLTQGLGRLLTNPKVLHVEVAKKVVGGQETTLPALRITVEEKLPREQLATEELIPSSIFGMSTDVVDRAWAESH